MSEAIGIFPCVAIRSLTAAAMSVGAMLAAIGDHAVGIDGAPDLERRLAGADFFQQGIDQRRQRQVRIHLVAHGHAAVQRLYGLAHVDPGFRDGEVGVANDLAHEEQAVRAFHPLCHFRQAGHPHVGAEQRRVVVGKQAAAHEAGHHRQA
jgi:hypothetical protein